MREPEERPGLPLWLPEPYHGPQPPEGFPVPWKPEKKPPTGKRPAPRASQRPAAVIRVVTVIVSAVFATVIILIAIILIHR